MTAPIARHLSESAEWYSPPELLESARRVMGGIDLDPASSHTANKLVGATRIHTLADDGLEQRWSGRVWLNPPGDRAGSLPKRFWGQLVRSYQAGLVPEAIYLGFSLEQLVSLQQQEPLALTQHLSPLAFPLCVPRRRVRYLRPSEVGRLVPADSPTHGSFLVYLGSKAEAFRAEFRQHGDVT